MRVRSPLLPQSRLISCPSVTEMFHFTEFWSIIMILFSIRGSVRRGLRKGQSPGTAYRSV